MERESGVPGWLAGGKIPYIKKKKLGVLISNFEKHVAALINCHT